jgi:hypothetical protein
MAENKWIPLATAAVLIEDRNWRWREEIRRALMLGKVKARGVIPAGVQSEIPPEGKPVIILPEKFASLYFQFSHSRLCSDQHFGVAAYEAVELRRVAVERHARKWGECERGAAENAEAIAKSFFDEPRWQIRHALNWIACRKIEALTLTPEALRSLRHQALFYKSGADDLSSKNPAHELLTALKADKLRAVGPDHKELPPEHWDAKSVDVRTWEWVRFRREDILRLWPDVETLAEDDASQESAGPFEVLESAVPVSCTSPTDRAPLGQNRNVARTISSRSIDALSIGSMRNAALARATAT